MVTGDCLKNMINAWPALEVLDVFDTTSFNAVASPSPLSSITASCNSLRQLAIHFDARYYPEFAETGDIIPCFSLVKLDVCTSLAGVPSEVAAVLIQAFPRLSRLDGQIIHNPYRRIDLGGSCFKKFVAHIAK